MLTMLDYSKYGLYLACDGDTAERIKLLILRGANTDSKDRTPEIQKLLDTLQGIQTLTPQPGTDPYLALPTDVKD